LQTLLPVLSRSIRENSLYLCRKSHGWWKEWYLSLPLPLPIDVFPSLPLWAVSQHKVRVTSKGSQEYLMTGRGGGSLRAWWGCGRA
jgi:hypothetical protein